MHGTVVYLPESTTSLNIVCFHLIILQAIKTTSAHLHLLDRWSCSVVSLDSSSLDFLTSSGLCQCLDTMSEHQLACGITESRSARPFDFVVITYWHGWRRTRIVAIMEDFHALRDHALRGSRFIEPRASGLYCWNYCGCVMCNSECNLEGQLLGEEFDCLPRM